MISSISPGFLAAGLALAAAPLLLHLLARRPPARQPLPTARFLREDARTLLRIQKRPTDVPLLLVRMAFALALGASFAGLTWAPIREGMGRIVLLDGGADTVTSWDAARELARGAALELTRAATPEQRDAGQGDAEQATIIVYGLDEGVRVVTARALAGLDRGTGSTTAEDGLRALRRGVLSQTRFERVDVAWVTRPSWRSWTTGVGLLRPALWPGQTPIVPVLAIPSAGSAGAGTVPPTTRTARLVGLSDDQAPLPRALRALGIGVTSGAAPADSVADLSFVEAPSAGELASLVERARAGSTVVLSGPLPNPHADSPWIPDEATSGEPSGIVLSTRSRLGLSIIREGGAPAAGAGVIAVFEDAMAAAVAVRIGDGCLVYLSASLQDPELTASPEYPSLVDALGKGCHGLQSIDGPLDQGALYALERPDLAAVVDVADLAPSVGYPLTRWLVLITLALIGLEVVMTRERRT